MVKKTILKIAMAALGAIGAVIGTKEYISKRKNRFDGLLKKVNEGVESAMMVVKDSECLHKPETSVLTMDGSFVEVEMTDDERQEWMGGMSLLMGEGFKSSLLAVGSRELLKCDIPLDRLVKSRQSPELMRGFARLDGGISQHANFTEAGLSAAQVTYLSMQCLSMITSQYYMNIIFDRLSEINGKIDAIAEFLEVKERAKLQTAMACINQICRKSTFTENDFNIVRLRCFDLMEVRNTYRNLLSGVTIKYEWKKSNYEEADYVLNSLDKSGYLKNLTMAYQADMRLLLANICLINIAMSLGKKDDADSIVKDLEVGLWDYYGKQFVEIKTKMLDFIKYERDDAQLKKEKIDRMLTKCSETFSAIERDIKSFDIKIMQKIPEYVGVNADGELVRYERVDNFPQWGEGTDRSICGVA